MEPNISEAAAAMGRIGGKSKSPAKVAAVKENGKHGGRPVKPLSAYTCTCGAGEGGKHRVACPMYHPERRRRIKAASEGKE